MLDNKKVVVAVAICFLLLIGIGFYHIRRPSKPLDTEADSSTANYTKVKPNSRSGKLLVSPDTFHSIAVVAFIGGAVAMLGKCYIHNTLYRVLGFEILHTKTCVPTNPCDHPTKAFPLGKIVDSLNRFINWDHEVCAIVYPCDNWFVILNAITFVTWAVTIQALWVSKRAGKLASSLMVILIVVMLYCSRSRKEICLHVGLTTAVFAICYLYSALAVLYRCMTRTG